MVWEQSRLPVGLLEGVKEDVMLAIDNADEIEDMLQ
jgi:hypothetical protein